MAFFQNTVAKRHYSITEDSNTSETDTCSLSGPPSSLSQTVEPSITKVNSNPFAAFRSASASESAQSTSSSNPFNNMISTDPGNSSVPLPKNNDAQNFNSCSSSSVLAKGETDEDIKKLSKFYALDTDVSSAFESWDEPGALQRRKLLTDLVSNAQLPRWSRMAAWCRISGAHLARTNGFSLTELIAKSEKENGVAPSVIHRIEKDLPRTRCNVVFEDQNPEDLKTLLVAYAYIDKEVGYVQGMNYIGALCIAHAQAQKAPPSTGLPPLPVTMPVTLPAITKETFSSLSSSSTTTPSAATPPTTIKGVASSHMQFNMPSILTSSSNPQDSKLVDPRRMAEAISHADSCRKIDSAFLLFTRMMQASGLRRNFDSKDDNLHILLQRLDWHLRNIMPDLHEHLEEEQVSTALFAVEWFTTLFIYNVSFDTASTILGLFLLQGGLNYMVTIGLAYLFYLKDELLLLDFDMLPITLKKRIKMMESQELLQAIANLYDYCSELKDYTRPNVAHTTPTTTTSITSPSSTPLSTTSTPASSSIVLGALSSITPVPSKAEQIALWKLILKRPRWVPDNELLCCRNCRRKFVRMQAVRRHHCRNCGGVVCGACSRSRSALPHLAYPNRVRVCAPCLSMGASVPAMMLSRLPRGADQTLSTMAFLCDLPSYCIEDLQFLSMKRWLPDDEEFHGTGGGGGDDEDQSLALQRPWFKKMNEIRFDLLSAKMGRTAAKEFSDKAKSAAGGLMKQSIESLSSAWEDLSDFYEEGTHSGGSGGYFIPEDGDWGSELGKMFGDICHIGQEEKLTEFDAQAEKVIEQSIFLASKDYVERFKLSTPTASKAQVEALAPKAFRCIRVGYGYGSLKFAESIGACLRSIGGGGGRSGAEFYLSYDRQFVIKTLPLFETSFLLELLPSYVEHVTANAKHTLLPRFLGLFRVRFPGTTNWKCFVVMPNLFRSLNADNEVCINEMYDLKGSIDARYVDKINHKQDKENKEKKERRRLKKQKKKQEAKARGRTMTLPFSLSTSTNSGGGGVGSDSEGSDSGMSSSEDESVDGGSNSTRLSMNYGAKEWDIIQELLHDAKNRFQTLNDKVKTDLNIGKSCSISTNSDPPTTESSADPDSDPPTTESSADPELPVSPPCDSLLPSVAATKNTSSTDETIDKDHDNTATNNEKEAKADDDTSSGIVLKDLNFCPFHGRVHKGLDSTHTGDAGEIVAVDEVEEYSLTGLHLRSKLKNAIIPPKPRVPNSVPQLSRRHSNASYCRKLRLGEDRRAVFLANVRNDTAWLREHNIMDYSLLLGVGTCKVKQVTGEKMRQSLYASSSLAFINDIDSNDECTDDDADVVDDASSSSSLTSSSSSLSSSAHHHHDEFWGSAAGSYWEKECGGVCATSIDSNERVSLGHRPDSCGLRSVPLGLPGDEPMVAEEANEDDETREWYTFGIIDILQKFDAKKQAEGFVKTTVLGKEGVSSVNPGLYSGRFVDYLEKHTV